jgi:chromosome segregation ATPase
MNKEEFKARAKQKIDEFSAKINELKAERAAAKEDSKSDYDEALKELESKKSELDNKYTELENAADDKWEEVKATFLSASNSFEEGFSKLKPLFKK